MAASNKPEDDIVSPVTTALCGHPQPHPPTTTTTKITHPDPDLPTESFRLPPQAELEWLDRSVAAAAIYERDDSTKGTANPKAQHQHHGSNRFSGPLKPPKSAILGLPKPVQRQSGYIGGGVMRKAGGTNTRIFPKKRGKGVEEPGSPKVSCFGKVRSDRERCREEQRRMRREARELEKDGIAAAAAADRSASGSSPRWSFLLLGPLACCRGNPSVGSVEEDNSDRRTQASSNDDDNNNKKKKNRNQLLLLHDPMDKRKHHRTSPDSLNSNPLSPHSSSPQDPPGLAGLKRFASGRRPSSWGGGEFEASGGGPGAVHANPSDTVVRGRKSVS